MRKFIKDKISIIIPTFNEGENINKLIDGIIHEVKNREFEIIIVDDGSEDQTVDNIFSIYKNNNSIKVIQREYDRGLVQSIKFALQSITGEYFVIMDGDGQHSPKDINLLVSDLKQNDLVIGCRDLANITAISKQRALLSKFFNSLVSIILSKKLADPLTGFFAGNISILNKKFFLLSNSGFKILLDLIFSNKKSNIKISEKTINFISRDSGNSKLGSQVVFSFITQIISYIFNGLISSKFIGFLIIGAFGFVIHFSILFLSLNYLQQSFYYSHVIATLITATINFILNNYLNFYNSDIKDSKSLFFALLKYYLINLPGFLTSIGGASFVYNTMTKNPYFSSFAGVILETIFKYIISKTWIWKSK